MLTGATALREAVTALDPFFTTLSPRATPAERRALRLTLLSIHQAVDQQSEDFVRAVNVRYALDEDDAEDSALNLTLPSRGLRD
jgi:hypothetical protein